MSVTITTVMGVNGKECKVFNTVLFSVLRNTNRKIPAKVKDCLHFSGVNGRGVVLVCLNTLCCNSLIYSCIQLVEEGSKGSFYHLFTLWM